jgi:serine/threonine protein kinase
MIGPYRLLARLGAGGMATVYFGRSPGRRAVAVKVMHAQLAAEPSYRARFRREARAARAVGGPYSPSVLSADPDAEIPWLATEFVPSIALRDAVSRHGRLPAASVLTLALGLAEALASMHRAGLAHLDLKPANVLLTHDGIRLIDFGIAAELSDDSIVSTGIRAGSWGFMSPEQVAGATAGSASDVFSFGATLAYACCDSHEQLRAIIADCLRPDPRDRPTVAELIHRLTSIPADAVPDATWLPAAVRGEIDRLASESENPPVPSPPVFEPAARRMSRRALFWTGVALGAGALGAVVLASRKNESESTASFHAPNAPASTSPSTEPTLRTVEFYAFGRTTVKTLTTTLDGRTETVHDVPLPYRRTIRLAPWSQPIAWRIEYHCTRGLFQCVILVDGLEVDGYGSSTTGEEMRDDKAGTI